jgi:hypothetical protein
MGEGDGFRAGQRALGRRVTEKIMKMLSEYKQEAMKRGKSFLENVPIEIFSP